MPPSKLTKKQKKAFAFRERKGKKPNPSGEENDVPEPDLLVEDEELLPESDNHQKEPQSEKNDKSSTLGKRKRDSLDKDDVNTSKAKEDATDGLGGKKKKKRPEPGAGQENGVKTVDESKAKTKSGDSSKSRFILFVGNLKYTTSIDAVREHFSKCDPPPQVRLLTPKPKTPGATTSAKSKGCAFLEFSHKNALQQAIKLHGSTLDGRRINVELTAGGGGKSDSRVQKVQARNKQLLEQRKKHVQKKLDAGENTDTIVIAPPQRHSTTSGMEHVPQQKRTWSVPERDETSGRGGAKQRGKKTKRPQHWATGANAITVN